MKGLFDYDYRIALAYGLNDGVWPKELTSGVMFYEGLRITRRTWNAYKQALDSDD